VYMVKEKHSSHDRGKKERKEEGGIKENDG
jgi:hypothetical protein